MKTARTDAIAARAALGADVADATAGGWDASALDAFDDALRRGERGERGGALDAALEASGDALETPLRALLAATQAAAAAAAQ
jgi:hypothetical protein